MKKYFILVVCALLSLCALGQGESSLLKATDHFEFHSNFWINLHHFLYQQAKGDQSAHLREDGNELLDIGDSLTIEQLNPKERELFEASVQYYRDHLSDKSLLFELNTLRSWLQERGSQQIADTSLSAELTEVLNSFSTVYRNHFWKSHHEHNTKVLLSHYDMIVEIEDFIVKRMEYFADYPWPDSTIRLDLTTYANYAGGYTQTRPNFNIFISTLDPFSTGYDFVETVFHEGSHTIFSRDSGFRSKLFLMSKEREMDIPNRQWQALWHASQFYLCGRLLQDELKKRNIEYEMTMDVRHVFSWFTTDEFRSILEAYYNETADLETTLTTLLNSLEEE